MLKSGIYIILCVPTDQAYVGSATSIEHRLGAHKRKLLLGRHSNIQLQAAFTKYGADAFEFEPIEECPVSDLLERERYWAEEFDTILSGFNSPQLGSNGFLTHGLTHSKVYKSWNAMIQRCTNKNAPDYPRYGAKGVSVCGRWLRFENFFADMGDRPLGTSLDRFPNRNGNYEPGNCRWATPKEQVINRDCTISITVDGTTKLLAQWAIEKSIPYDLLLKRFHAGMKDGELFAPSYSRYDGDGINKRRKRIETRQDLKKYEFEGKMLSITELSVATGIPRSALSQRLIKYRMPLNKALTAAPLKKGKAGPRKGHNMLTAFGRTQSLTSWAREYNLSVSTLKNRITRANMPVERALTVGMYSQQRNR